MPDVQVGNGQRSFLGSAALMTVWTTALLALTYLKTALVKGNTQVTPSTPLTGITEADYAGYSRQTVASFTNPAVDQTNQQAYSNGPLQDFTCAGGGTGNSIGAAVLLGAVAGGTTATATNLGDGAGNYNATFTITSPGSKYQAPPPVHLTGATGAGATAHSTLNPDGTLASVVLDNPGNGAYTTFTVVIDPPIEIIAFANFDQPVPMNVATDALPFVWQVNIGIS